MVELKMLVATCYETTNLKSGKIFAINQEIICILNIFSYKYLMISIIRKEILSLLKMLY